jgi:hypothetical protein
VGSSEFTFDSADALIAATIDAFRPYRIRRVVYRLCDYDGSDFTFFSRRDQFSARGAQRLLDDEMLLEYDISMVDAFLAEGIAVDVLVPFVQFPDQLLAIHKRLDRFFTGSRKPSRIGMTLEVPANLIQMRDFDLADFYVFGINDLLKFYFGGVDRNSRHYAKVAPRLLIDPIRGALSAINGMGQRSVYLMKSLVELSREFDLAEYPNTTFRRFVMPHQLPALAQAPAA